MSFSIRRRVCVLDYGVGNQTSIMASLERMGYQVVLSKKYSELKNEEIIFLPGVGYFPYAMDNLEKSGIGKFLVELHHKNEKKIIGICLGMQLFFESSEEGSRDGLGVIPGKVIRFKNKECHVGWNIVDPKKNDILENKAGFYFNHSYHVSCKNKYVYGISNYQKDFPVLVKSNNFYGLQFHPEKSQNAGVHIIKKIIGS